MAQIQINSPEDIIKLFNQTKKQATEIASSEAVRISKEIAEQQFDLLEFNLFISSFGKNLTDATLEVEELRKKIDKGEIDLSGYEVMAEEFC